MILCLSLSVKRNSKLFRALLHFLIFAAAVFVIEAVPASAQVFKWVDERGVTHYGERPPQGAKASEVQNKLASPAPGSAGGADSSPPRDQRPEGQAASKDAAAKPKPPPTREELEAAKRQTQCDQQRAILDRLKSSPPSYTLNDKGEKVPFDNSEIISQQEKRVAQQCPRG
jgi:uncharacterized protein DUF4124